VAFTILIPALNPSRCLVQVASELAADARVDRILLVNDGSAPRCLPAIEETRRTGKVEYLAHDRNLGKGAALKSGIRRFLASSGAADTLVTADADGQHLPRDILAVAETGSTQPGALVLGSRSFSADVPLRSRFGNDLTRVIFREITGQPLPDTQTGLRAIPRALLEKLLEVRASRYEFELEMLLMATLERVPVRAVPIQTVYLENNAASHFRPVMDSVRIYAVLLRHVARMLLPGSVA
jgi:glycosyltransferase involved in cell wall biosynthesis